jgi:uncharacterized damage-inducible protein DinB
MRIVLHEVDTCGTHTIPLENEELTYTYSHKRILIMIRRVTVLTLFAVCLTLNIASAQTSFHDAFLSSFDQANEKVVALAGAFSQDQYGWRPDEGVRSVSEALMHVAGANFFFGGMLGGEVPADYEGKNLEAEVSNKEDAIKALKASIEFARSAIAGVSTEALDEQIELFGNDAPRMSLVLLIGDHANEHLGQLIAYARSNDVTPPWSN